MGLIKRVAITQQIRMVKTRERHKKKGRDKATDDEEKIKIKVAPKGCHHKAIVQCRGQRGGP